MSEWTHCPSCGTRIRASDPTCRNCGAALAAATTGDDDGASPAAQLLESDKLAAELHRTLAPEIQLLRKLGEGGMSTVYLARDPALRRLIAIKVLSPDQTKDTLARARFAREAEIAAAVSHPHVVGIHKVGTLSRSKAPYILMEYVDGPTLADVLQAGTAIPEARAKRIVGEVASALATAHARGLVHRDIKPANIVLDRETDRAVVLDFGVSAAIDRQAVAGTEKLTLQGVSVGTPIYMSPEQAAARPLTDRSDVYNLGAVAFELVTGRPPFLRGGPEAYLAAHLQDRPPDVRTLRPGMDPQFAELINRCLAKQPGHRPAAEKIARALLPSARQLVEWPPPGLERLRGVGWYVLLSLAATVVLGLTFLGTLLLDPGPALSDLVSDPAGVAPLRDSATVPLSSVLRTASLVATWLAALVACVQAVRLGVFARWGRSSGYPWTVLLSVALDPRADTAKLLNANGAFALISEATRRWLIRLRRLRAAVLLVTIAVATAALVGWSQGWFAAGDAAPNALLDGSEAALLLVPTLVGAILSALLAVPEGIVRHRARPWELLPWLRPTGPYVRDDLVRHWLAPTGRELAAPPPPAALWTGTLLPGLATGAVAAALLFALGLTLWATATAARWRNSRWAAAAALVEAARSGPPWQEVMARAVAVSRLRTRSARVGAEAWAAADSAALALAAEPVVIAWTTGPRRPWWKLPGGPPPSIRNLLAGEPAASALGTWRAVAVSRRPPVVWSRRGAPDDTTPLTLSREGTLTLTRLNEIAGLAAFAAGDRARALLRARENVAVGRWLLVDPLNGHLAPAVLDNGRAMLFDLGVLTADRALLIGVAELGAVLPHPTGPLADPHPAAALLMTAPRAPAGLALAADTALAPDVRWAFLEGTIAGYCGSGREVLFGVDARRRQILGEAAAAAADISRTDDWAAQLESRLDAWIEAPGGPAISQLARRRGVLRVAGWLGLRGFANRTAYCQAADPPPP